ncbi:Fumarylacetoacetase [Meredithblackwellia eburnea MCA 4105]
MATEKGASRRLFSISPTSAAALPPPASDSHFGLANIPFGIFSSGETRAKVVGTRYGDKVIDLSDLASQGVFQGIVDGSVFSQSTLRELAAQPRVTRTAVRAELIKVIKANSVPQAASIDVNSCIMHLPFKIGNYTDFLCGREHSWNCAKVFNMGSALPPAMLHQPPAYHSRASSVVISGTSFHRPYGNYRTKDGSVTFGPSKCVDYETELACFVSRDAPANYRITVKDAEEYIFGLVILNDWSIRDVQSFEWQPLGPFNGKNPCTSISPWVVTLDALKPFQVPLPDREVPIAPYLHSDSNPDVSMRISVRPAGMDKFYTTAEDWNFAQMLAQHSVGGCNLQAGDLIGSGTISDIEPGTMGCLLESSAAGTNPVPLGDSGLERGYLEDGDTVAITAKVGPVNSGVGFGEVVGTILPCIPFSDQIESSLQR